MKKIYENIFDFTIFTLYILYIIIVYTIYTSQEGFLKGPFSEKKLRKYLSKKHTLMNNLMTL